MAKIIQLVDSSGIGGIERHIATLTGGLRAHNFDAEILLYADHGPHAWLDQLRAENLPFSLSGGSYTSLVKHLRVHGATLIHTHGYKAGILGRLAALHLGIPVVSTFHAGERGRFPVSLYQAVDQWSAFCTPSIAVSQPIADNLRFGATLIPNFIAAPEGPASAPLPQTIAFVGRLSHEKGPDIFGELARRHSGVASFHFFGDGPMRAELEHAYGDVANFHGMATNMSSIWPQIGLLMISSRAEGLPMVALEALAAGVPVASARLGALPTLIDPGQNGWLFQPAHLEEASAAIEAWSTRREDPALRRQCWQTIERGYSLSQGLSRILSVYSSAGFNRTAQPESSSRLAAAAPIPARPPHKST